MTKRRPSFEASQLGFTFEPPVPARADAELAGFDRRIAAKVALALKDDPRSRDVIAGSMTALLDDEVSRAMLDGYASEARDNHNISAARFFALIAVTERFDLLDATLRQIGAAVLVGEEIITARLGHLKSRMRELQQEIRAVEAAAAPITRGDRRA
jgi:hypothetical protein